MPFNARSATVGVCFQSIRILATLTLAVLLPSIAEAQVRWRNGPADTPRRLGATELTQSLTALGARETLRRVVVHVDGPLDASRRQALERDGVKLLHYLGDHAYFATLTPELVPARAASRGILLRVDAVRTANKMHPELAAGIIREWSRLEPAPAPEEIKPGQPAADPVVAVYVLFHQDVDAARDAAGIVGRHGGKVRSLLRSIGGAVAHLPASRIPELAAEDDVRWVEPPLPRMSPLNDSNRVLIEADAAQLPPYGLDGSGVTVLVYDAGKMFDHPDFGGRMTVGATDTDSISDHATHVGGTIGGDGGDSSGQYRGMAPAVDFISFAYEQEGGLQQGFLYTDPGDLEADYSAAIGTYGADISNNSIGTNTAPNGFPCEWEGNYGATGALIDAIVRGSLGEPFRVVWANGNERSSGACGTTYLTTAPPACAKNHITVGALNSDSDQIASFSSWGPTDDGRIKPDVSAPGCEQGGDGGVTSTGSSGGYNVKCGTSMASPTVTGVGALLLQQYRQSFPGRPDFLNATLKSILANTAVDIHETGPDYKSGFGSVRATRALDAISDERFVEAAVAQGEIYSFLVIVGPGDTELKVTVAWDDPPGTPNVNPVLVNDLDLRVIDPSGATHYPWTLDPANPADPAVRTQRDGANNIEQVTIDGPAPGAYRVEVLGFNIAEGPSQSFGAAAGPSLVNCAPDGVVGADRARITCSGDLGLRVIDCDLNTDDGVVEAVDVTIASDSEPGGESVTLLESAPESAAFLGEIPVAGGDAAGVLAVSEGDTITATYVDADDGDGGTNVVKTATIVVDCTAPGISGVATTEVNPRDATVSFDTDEPARATVRYGTDCAATTQAVARFQLQTDHAVRLGGLADDTTYYYRVEALDEAGNLAADDASGACYSFTTPEIPDFFTEQFASGIDVTGMMATFEPVGGTEYYALCLEPLVAGVLPTDPARGMVLSLGDDDSVEVALDLDQQVSIYGQNFASLFVSSNGYVTFGVGDSTYIETLAKHFEIPRVSARFDDLNPGAGGMVRWLQLADRAAITWQGVPEYSTTNSNTFQIELFFDGRIRVSWLELAGSDGIVGVSEGNGLSPDFFQTDLTGAGACGPRPPFAASLAFATPASTPLSITLEAVDDGLPEPQALTFRVTGLPSMGALTDALSGAPITGVPYELGGDGVTYTPTSGHHGSDAFSYVADDGGAAPDGGPSPPATVSVAVGGEQVFAEFLVDDGDPGWLTSGMWAFGSPTGAGSNNGDPTAGATGSNVYGYNLGGDYGNMMPEHYLVTGMVDLSGARGVRLEFERWLGVDDAAADHAAIEMRIPGVSNWIPVWTHEGPAISDAAWMPQSLELGAAVDGRMAAFRWVMGTTNRSGTYPGWNVDDVRFVGLPFESCSAAPGEVPALRVAGDKQTVQWGPGPFFGGELPIYDVLRSDTPQDFDAATCLAGGDVPATQVADAQVPAVGEVFHYLVRSQNSCGNGGLGQQSSGQERSAPPCGAP